MPALRRHAPAWKSQNVYDGSAVVARSASVFVASFHPELTPDHRLHSLFLQEV